MMAGYYGNRLYRSRKGEIFGVCQGIADWRGLPVGPIRLGVVLLAIFTSVAPMLVIYLLLALILPVEPEGRRSRRFYEEEDIASSYRENRGKTVHDLKREFDNLKKKVSGMEGKIFDEEQDKEQEWEERFRKEE